jgi:catechol 2,3-dioxygenase-like lactoylglutathione lyase family enzyme
VLQGLRTVVMRADDLEKSKAWYARLLGMAPYFDTPYYVGFNVGGFELGLHPGGEDLWEGVDALTYWGVADIDAARARLLELGAKEHQPIQDVGEGIRLATVRDPFGIIVGIIENPHFKVP